MDGREQYAWILAFVFFVGMSLFAIFLWKTENGNSALREQNAELVEKLIVQEISHEKVVNSLIRRRR